MSEATQETELALLLGNFEHEESRDTINQFLPGFIVEEPPVDPIKLPSPRGSDQSLKAYFPDHISEKSLAANIEHGFVLDGEPTTVHLKKEREKTKFDKFLLGNAQAANIMALMGNKLKDEAKKHKDKKKKKDKSPTK